MKKEVKNWLDSAQYDLTTAKHMFQTGRYIYTIFMCHLALEKLLKAKVQEKQNRLPPKIHNLRQLLKMSAISIKDRQLEFISKLSDVSIVTRYPEDFQKLMHVYDKKTAQHYLKTTREIYKWIKKLF